MKFSLTYVGVITYVVGAIFRAAGVPFVPENISITIATITELAGALISLYGRYRAGGVSALGFKK